MSLWDALMIAFCLCVVNDLYAWLKRLWKERRARKFWRTRG